MEFQEKKDLRFGSIAVELGFISSEKLDRALVIQKRIKKEAKVHRHVGEILLQMQVLTQAQRDEILAYQDKNKDFQVRDSHDETSPSVASVESGESENSIAEVTSPEAASPNVSNSETSTPALSQPEQNQGDNITINDPDQDIEDEEGLFDEESETSDDVDEPEGDSDEDRGHILSYLSLQITKDKMRAILTIDRDCDEALLVSDVKALLEKQKVQYGFIEDKKIKTYLKMDPKKRKPMKVAQGTPPKVPEPDKLVYHFDTDPMKIGTELEDGSIDWKNRGQLPQVKEGALLAEIIQGAKGTPGRNILGRFVPPPKKARVVLKRGKGVEGSEDGLKVLAKTGGMPKIAPDGRIHIYSTLNIKGDIGIETGHVEFDGHIEVTGIVQKGYEVKGQSLRAMEFYESDYRFGGDMLALRGVFGATIRCEGNFKGGHVHYSDIRTMGNLVSQKEIFESTIESTGEVIIDTGVIVASTVRAKKGVNAKEIGTLASKPCQIDVGIDYRLLREVGKRKKELLGLKDRKDQLETLIKEKQERSDDVNTQLGIIAQEQDAFMVENRKMEDSLKAARKAGDEKLIASIETHLAELSEKLKATDDVVMNFFQEDGQLNEDIPLHEKEIEEIDERTEELESEIDTLEMESEADEAVAVIKVNGKIISGTRIKGPHCNFKVDEDLYNVRIAEVKNNDDPENSFYEFKVTNLR